MQISTVSSKLLKISKYSQKQIHMQYKSDGFETI